jgi:hypothetical protein
VWIQQELEDCIRLCDRLSDLIEEDQLNIGQSLEGKPADGYRELARLEIELLAECKRLMVRGW